MAKPPKALASAWGSHTHFSQHSPGTCTLRGMGQSGPGSIMSRLQRGTQVICPSQHMHWYLQLGIKVWPFWYTEPSKTHTWPPWAGGAKKSWITLWLHGCGIRSGFIVEGQTPTNTETRPLADVFGVVTPQPFARVAGAHVRACLPSLTGAHQAAGAVIQDQGHSRGAGGGLVWTLTSTRTVLGPG